MTLTTEWQTISSSNLAVPQITIALQGKYTSQSISGNYTDTEFRIINFATNSYTWKTTNGTVALTGAYTDSQSCATYPYDVVNNQVLLSVSKRIYHDNDGSKSITLGGYLDATIGGTKYYAVPSQETVVIPKIDRVSSLSIDKPIFNIGDTLQATITQYISSYHQDLYMVINGNETLIQSSATGTIEIETSLLANTIYQTIPNAKYYSNVFRLKTYDSNNTLIGNVEVNYTANVVNSNPTFNIAYKDTNATTKAITNNDQQIIQNNSTLQFNFTNATALHYATLSSYKITINGEIKTGSISSSTLNVNWGTLNLSSNTNASVEITDSRGFTTTKTVSLIILGWELPNAIITCNRKQNYYTETDITVDANYSSLDNKNVITIQYRIKKTSTSTWGNWNNLTDNITTTFNADNLYSWDIQVKVQDSIGNTTYNLTIGVGLPIFFIDRLKKSLGLNCFPNENESIEVNGINILNNLNYSANETPIGYWNSSIYYRKAISGTTLGTYFDTGIGANVVDDIVDARLFVCVNGAWRSIPWLYVSGDAYGSGSWAGGFFFDSADGYVYIQAGSDLLTIDKYNFVIEYTKV